MASGSLSTEELEDYHRAVIEPRFKLYTNIGRVGKVDIGSPAYMCLEKARPAGLHRALDGAIEMELRHTVAQVGLLAMRLSDEYSTATGMSMFDSVWHRANDYLSGQQG